MDIVYHPIGVIRSPFTETAGMPIQPRAAGQTAGAVEVDPRYREGLADLEGFSHVILLYHFHRAAACRLCVTPFLDAQPRGVFATRAPTRPNPIGISVVRLERVEGATLHVEGIDVLDGTPLLDIKPHVPDFAAPGALRLGWLTDRMAQAPGQTADERFT